MNEMLVATNVSPDQALGNLAQELELSEDQLRTDAVDGSYGLTMGMAEALEEML